MKRLIAMSTALIVAIGAIGLMAGCAGTGGAPAAPAPAGHNQAPAQEGQGEQDQPRTDFPPVVMYSRYFVTDDVPVLVKLREAIYEELGIIIEPMAAPTGFADMVPQITAMLAARSSDIDIMHIDELLTVSFAHSGFLAPIDDVMTPEIMAYFPSAIIETNVVHNGQAFVVPGHTGPMYFYINRALFQEAGIPYPPLTREEFIYAAQRLTGNGVYGYGAAWITGGMLYNDFIRWVYAHDGNPFDMNNPNTRAALQTMYDFLYYYEITPITVFGDDYNVANQRFADGQYGMMYAWASLYMNNVERFESGEFMIAPVPTFETNHSISAGWKWGLSAFSENQEAARKVLSFLASAEGQRILTYSVDGTCVRMDVLNDPELIREKPLLGYLGQYAAAGSLRPRPMPVEVNEIMNGIEPILQMFLIRELSLEETAERVQSVIDNILSQ